MRPRQMWKTTLGCLMLAGSLILGEALAAEQKIGAVTRQPLPRWVSLKAPEANARRGPSMNHRVDWVFRHRNMPLLVTAEHEHWRRVVDRDGVGGWVHYVLLSRARTVIVDTELQDVFRSPDVAGEVVARAEQGVVAQLLEECEAGWCRVSAGGRKGWVPQSALWGAGTAGFDQTGQN